MYNVYEMLDKLTASELGVLLVCLTIYLYPFLADSGVAFDAPVLVQFLSEKDLKCFLRLARSFIRVLPVRMIGCLPKELRKCLEYLDGNTLIFRFNHTRY